MRLSKKFILTSKRLGRIKSILGGVVSPAYTYTYVCALITREEVKIAL